MSITIYDIKPTIKNKDMINLTTYGNFESQRIIILKAKYTARVDLRDKPKKNNATQQPLNIVKHITHTKLT